MMNEKVVWKRVAIVLSVLLVASLVLRTVLPADTMARVTSFTLGGLFSIAVGYTVVDPRSSPVSLPSLDETAVRRGQLVVGLVISASLGVLLFVDDVRAIPFSWFFVPIIGLGPWLVAREVWLYRRAKRH